MHNHSRHLRKQPTRYVGTAASLLLLLLGGCADSLPTSALPTREAMERPILARDEQQKAVDELVKGRDQRQSEVIQALETKRVTQ